MQLKICLVALAVALSSVFRTSTTENAVHRSNLLAEGLGLLLGLPFRDMNVGPAEFERAPEFLSNLYDCRTSEGLQSCMQDEEKTREQLEHADLVRSFIGKIDESHSSAVHSYNTEVEILNTQMLIFNTSCSIKSNETLHCADLRVFKEALNEDQIRAMKNSCGNDLSDIQLHLYTKLRTTSKGMDVMWLLQNTTVLQNELSQSKWIVFHNITDAYVRSFEDHSLSFRLALGGSCTGVNPSNLGLTSKSGKESLIVGYSRSGGISDEDARRAFGVLTQVHQKRRRQADEVSTTTNQSVINFATENCRLYPFDISFEELGWHEVIVQPSSYPANFCGGVCPYPLNQYHNTTKHSYIQSIVHFSNPNDVPPPCCAPKTMSSLSIIYREGPQGPFTMQTWNEMVADSCGCL